MCLYVKSPIPNDILAMKCIKDLRPWHDGQYTTPYTSWTISEDGVLWASRPAWWDDESTSATIEIGYIHAYSKTPYSAPVICTRCLARIAPFRVLGMSGYCRKCRVNVKSACSLVSPRLQPDRARRNTWRSRHARHHAGLAQPASLHLTGQWVDVW